MYSVRVEGKATRIDFVDEVVSRWRARVINCTHFPLRNVAQQPRTLSLSSLRSRWLICAIGFVLPYDRSRRKEELKYDARGRVRRGRRYGGNNARPHNNHTITWTRR